MLRELKISNFRCFESFAAQDLAPINLIVGRNNAGKTCLMEALELVATGSPAVLARALQRRREVVSMESGDTVRRSIQTLPDVRCAFRQRATTPGSRIEFGCSGPRAEENRRLTIARGLQLALPGAFTDVSSPDESFLDVAEPEPQLRRSFEALDWITTLGSTELKHRLPLRSDGGLLETTRSHESQERLPTRSIHTNHNPHEHIAELWGPIAATDHEDEVLELLQIVEPRIEKIAATPGLAGGIFIRLRGERGRIPLGSFGDGTARLFSLACNIISARRGILLVDEIDTGLHFSAVAKMWRFLSHAARRLDLQVFATTHSKDCLAGLAQFCAAEPPMAPSFRLHRLERDASTWTTYSAEEIEQAMDADIEVR